MHVGLEGKVAIVTGGTRGIGRAIAQAFAASGAQVVVVSRKAEACEEAAREIGHGCVGMAANVGDIEAAEQVVDAVVGRFGRVDVLVNNAATMPHQGLTIDVDMGRWNKTLLVNLSAPLFWSQLVWNKSMKHGEQKGCIINISSVGGLWTSEDHGVYDISKAAQIHLTKQLAAELGPKVRVNTIAPGLTKTDFNRLLFVDDPDGTALAQKYPLQRLGRGEDVADAAVFLASDRAGWITGQLLAIDGGGQIGFHRYG